jgi:hypothetical protein
MAYVPEKITVAGCLDCGWEGTPDDVDDYDGCPHCGAECEIQMFERDPRFWSVALYDTHQSYGGPEEGGWHYESGDRLVETVRNFEKFDEAVAYADSLETEHLDIHRLKVKAYANKMAPCSYPQSRPHYS